MRNLSFRFSSVLLAAWLASSPGQLHAQLPSLEKPQWFGFFVGYTGTRGMFGISAEGLLFYNHGDDQGSVNGGNSHRIYPSVR